MNIGYEKLSDHDKRQAKVNELKDKIRDEIQKSRNQELYLLNNFNMNKSLYKSCILKMTALFAIEDFINQEDTFMHYTDIYGPEDVIIYELHIDMISLMLDTSFNFVNRVMLELDKSDDEVGYYFVGDVLKENFIRHNLISIFDELEYERKMKEGQL